MLKHTGIQFEITNTQIALIGKKTKKTTGKPIVVRGTVLDENNEPVIGANVVVEGTTTGVITDFNGEYSLEAPEGANLQISYIGYTSQTVKAGNKSAVIKLKEDSQMLSEVVVVGYGTMKKQDLTGAVNSLKATDNGERTASDYSRYVALRCCGFGCWYGDRCKREYKYDDSW